MILLTGCVSVENRPNLVLWGDLWLGGGNETRRVREEDCLLEVDRKRWEMI